MSDITSMDMIKCQKNLVTHISNLSLLVNWNGTLGLLLNKIVELSS